MVKRMLFTLGILSMVVLTPELARASETCATDLANCYVAAAKIDSFWYRWAAGLDCELQFTNCARIMIIGAYPVSGCGRIARRFGRAGMSDA